MFALDTTNKIPVYVQIKKQVLEFISMGILSKDEQLPSVRSVAQDHGINPNTVSKAYKELEDEGYIYSLKGKGCFVKLDENTTLIKDEKLSSFKNVVLDMKKHNITKKELFKEIEFIYKEDEGK